MADPSGPWLRSSISPLVNSISRPLHLMTIKPAGTFTLLILIPTALLPLTLQNFLFLKPSTLLPNSSIMLILLPFHSAALTALLKPGGLLADAVTKRRKAFAKAHEGCQNYLATSRYTSTVKAKAGLAFLLKPAPVKSFYYFVSSQAPLP